MKFPKTGLKMVPRIYDPKFQYNEIAVCGYAGEYSNEGNPLVAMKFNLGEDDNGE